MLDRKFVVENVAAVAENCRLRGADVDVAAITQLNEEWRNKQAEADRVNQQANETSKQIGRAGSPEEREKLKEEGRRLRGVAQELKQEVEAASGRLDELLRQLPNMTHPDSPVGGEADSTEVARGATPIREMDFKPLDHVDLGERLDWFDFEAGARVAGHGFYFLKHEAVLLDLALQRFALEVLREEGFTLTTTPDLARNEVLQGTGYMPRGPETQIYSIEGSDLSLVATAEITLGGMLHGELVDETELPILLAGLSHCYRTEAGAHGRATRGLYRVHQFTKVEMFAFTTPEESDATLERLRGVEQRIFDALEIPYRVIDTATGDLGGPAYRKYDLEAWMPGRGESGEWGEVTSTSNCTDFQARRLGVRSRRAGEKGTRFVHTLNGTAAATGRAMIALMENHQQSDGAVAIPAALQPYLGFDHVAPRSAS